MYRKDQRSLLNEFSDNGIYLHHVEIGGTSLDDLLSSIDSSLSGNKTIALNDNLSYKFTFYGHADLVNKYLTDFEQVIKTVKWEK